MNPETITMLVESVCTILGILLTAYIIPWFKNKVGENKYDKLVEFTKICVRAAEQLFSDAENELKKSYVRSQIIIYADQLAIGLNESQLDAIIEGIVNSIKKGQ